MLVIEYYFIKIDNLQFLKNNYYQFFFSLCIYKQNTFRKNFIKKDE